MTLCVCPISFLKYIFLLIIGRWKGNSIYLIQTHYQLVSIDMFNVNKVKYWQSIFKRRKANPRNIIIEWAKIVKFCVSKKKEEKVMRFLEFVLYLFEVASFFCTIAHQYCDAHFSWGNILQKDPNALVHYLCLDSFMRFFSRFPSSSSLC